MFTIFQRKHTASWSQSFDVGPLKARIAALPVNDPLLPLILGFLDAQIVSQADARVTADAAQQFIGRVNMCSDLKHEFRAVWLESHRPPKV